jgi:peptide/nickel transport system permease protein
MKYYVRRITFYLITLWAAISLNFFLPRFMPGDPATILLAKMARNGDVTPATIRSIELLLGSSTDASLWDQYTSYWSSLFRGDLGVSVSKYPTPVVELIAQAIPWTVALVGLATIISFVLGISLGAWAGWKRGTWADSLIPFTTILQSVPYFWLALILVYFLAVQNPWFPIAWGYDVYSFSGTEWSWPFIKSAILHGTLPALTIVLSSVGGWLLGMRNMTVSTLAEDYITTAEAKGLRPRRIFFTYAMRNASLPSIAGFAITLGFVVGGSIVMEQVFSYPGVGKLMITAVQNSDYALMQGVFLVITSAVLAANFLMDMLYGFIDPRARHNG